MSVGAILTRFAKDESRWVIARIGCTVGEYKIRPDGNELVPIMWRLIGSVLVEAQVVRLFIGQFGQPNAELAEMQ